jgi:hypothetical protein
MKCGDCKFWKPVPVYDDDTDAMVLQGLGWCMRIDGDEVICGGPDGGGLSSSDVEKLGARDAAACDGSGYRAALLTRDRFGCVGFAPGKYEETPT